MVRVAADWGSAPRVQVLALAFIASAWAQERICRDPGTYMHGGLVPGSNSTCALSLARWEGVDWASFVCDDAPSEVGGMAVMPMLGQACCADGKSACWVDRSRVCKRPSAYTPDAVIPGNDFSCEMNLAGASFEGVDWATFSCADAPQSVGGEAVMHMLGQACCSDGRGACWEDRSRVCMDPEAYMPDSVLPANNFSCEMNLAGPGFQGIRWDAFKCSDAPRAAGGEALMPMLGSACCRDARSACWVDRSRVCRNRAAYNPKGFLPNGVECALNLAVGPGWKGVNWASFTCTDAPHSLGGEAIMPMVGKACCRDGASACGKVLIM